MITESNPNLDPIANEKDRSVIINQLGFDIVYTL